MPEVNLEVSRQGRVVRDYYSRYTTDWYLSTWHPEHIHLGLFEPEDHIDLREQPTSDKPSPNLTRALERMIDEVVEPAVIRPGEHVVDAGCGVGGTARYIVGKYGCRVTGLNVSRTQLAIAEQQTKEAGLDRLVDFTFADCSLRLPFPDASIDAVVNIESACHYDDRPQFLREVRRILKPGGRLAASDWLVTERTSPAHFEEYIRPLCSSWALPNLETRSSYVRILREAGLETGPLADFGGRDFHNAHLFGQRARLLFKRWMYGQTSELEVGIMKQLATLHAAWRRGHFEMGRYCAQRPEEPDWTSYAQQKPT